MFRILYLPEGYYIRLCSTLPPDNLTWPPGNVWDQGYYGLFSKKKAYAFAREMFSSNNLFCPINCFTVRKSSVFYAVSFDPRSNRKKGWVEIDESEALQFSKVPPDYFEIVQVPVSYDLNEPDNFIRSD